MDGYTMARKGEAARAFDASFTSSVLGGIIGVLVLTFSIPIIRPLVLTFGTAYLLDGIPLGLLALGLFAVPELVSIVVRRTQISEIRVVKNLARGQWEGAKDALRNWGTVVRWGILGSRTAGG